MSIYRILEMHRNKKNTTMSKADEAIGWIALGLLLLCALAALVHVAIRVVIWLIW